MHCNVKHKEISHSMQLNADYKENMKKVWSLRVFLSFTANFINIFTLCLSRRIITQLENQFLIPKFSRNWPKINTEYWNFTSVAILFWITVCVSNVYSQPKLCTYLIRRCYTVKYNSISYNWDWVLLKGLWVCSLPLIVGYCHIRFV